MNTSRQLSRHERRRMRTHNLLIQTTLQLVPEIPEAINPQFIA